MNRLIAVVPTVWRQIVRTPVRTGLTVSGIAVAMFLFTSVEAMRAGVDDATQATAEDTTLVVYREDRFCPFTSRLPQFYGDRIGRIEGVETVIPMQILVSNCRASLDVVTFRGVPGDDLETTLGDAGRFIAGAPGDWRLRSDAAVVGESLAARRGVSVGDRFSAAGITVYVAGIVASERAQDRNVAYVQLPFLQETMTRGGTGGIVTQFNVTVDTPARMEEIAAVIDAEFEHDEHPTSTWPEKAFVGRAVRDVIEMVGFAGWVGWASLAAVLALIANAIILAMRDRIRDQAVLQTLGYTGGLLAWMVLLEGAILGFAGGVIGGAASTSLIAIGRFSMSMEGVNVEIVNDPRLALLGACIAILLGLLAGAVPALRAARSEITEGLRAI